MAQVLVIEVNALQKPKQLHLGVDLHHSNTGVRGTVSSVRAARMSNAAVARMAAGAAMRGVFRVVRVMPLL